MMQASPALKRVLASNCCSGCGLCASLAPAAIAMRTSEDGFSRPQQTATVPAAAEAQIAAACPGLVIDRGAVPAADHVLWGPVIACRTGHASDAGLRHHASSGGVISALLTHLLETGEVDYVLQVAASVSKPIENRTVCSATAEAIMAAAGSRYAPSSPLERLLQHLDQPGRFALVGKPCDIAAVRALGRSDPRVAAKIPYLISFFCAGIPSRRGTEQILTALGVAESDVTRFAYRGDGWPGFATAETRDGRLERMSYAGSWGNILSKHVQFRCKICPDGSGGFADVVCGDAWESDERGYPKFAEQDGVSLIVSRTAKGEALVRAAMATKAIAATDLAVADIQKMQPAQAQRKRLVLSRLLAMALMGRSRPRFTGLRLREAAGSAGPIANVKSFLGLVRRLARGLA